MKREWTIGRRFGTAFAVMFAVLAATAVSGIWSARTIKAGLDETVSITSKRLETALHAQGLTTAMFFEERSLILATVTGDTELYTRASGRLAQELEQYGENMATLHGLASNDADRQTVARLKASMAAWRTLNAAIVVMLGDRQATEAHVRSDKEGRPVRDALRKDFESLLASQRSTLAADMAAAARVYDIARGLQIALVLLAVAAGAGVVFVVRTVNRRLSSALVELGTGAQQVVGASGQVAASSQSLSQGATEQAASLEETSASMEEMASMTRRNAENSERAAGLMDEAARVIGDANGALQDLVGAMAGIQESSDKVAKIIKTIDEIAFQTNILALNAAVEAARAGEAGMGFAVVADEVRNLAQRSAQAAKDTAGLIDDASRRAADGGTKVGRVAASIGAITQSATQVKSLVDEISLASRQQTQGIDQVTQAITQMEQVTQTTAATAEEGAAASEELNAQAEQTLATVQTIARMVRSQADARPAAVEDVPASRLARRLAA